MNAPVTRSEVDRRVNKYCVWTDRRQSDRRISPAVGEYAIQEAHRLREINRELRAALQLVHELIAEGAMTGFNCNDGDWANRLFSSQYITHTALAKAQS